MPYDLGEQWTADLTVRDPDGNLADATVTTTVTSPTGVESHSVPEHLSIGQYQLVVALTEPLWWDLEWQVTGAVEGIERQRAYVRQVAAIPVRTSTTVTVDEVQEILDEQGDPVVIDLLLHAAEDLVADYVGSPLEPTEIIETHPRGGAIVLAQSRVLGPASVVDGNNVAVTGYELNPAGILTEPYGYRWPSDATVTVRYTAGFDPLPDAIRLAVLYTVQHAYEGYKGAVVNDAGADESFVISRGFALPNRAKEFLAPYQRGPVVV